MKEHSLAKKRRVCQLIRRLRKTYSDVRCGLHFGTPWELLVATILSAQCTDKQVNKITPSLFKKFPDVQAFASARQTTLEKEIYSTGFYRNKAKNILGSAKLVLKKFHGNMPSRMEELLLLPGVGRKTANVVLGHAFGIPGISVDTHMVRINRRLGLTQSENPVRIEADLMKLVAPKDWVLYSDLIIRHGRVCCFARHPRCLSCGVLRLCFYGRGKLRIQNNRGNVAGHHRHPRKEIFVST